VVAHGGPLRAVLRYTASSHEGPILNCHVVRVEVDGDDVRVQ
jgi:broad specificity phosphatase PhoE